MKLILKVTVLSNLLFLGCLVLACSGGGSSPSSSENQILLSVSDSNTNKFDIAEFERNRELWTSKNIQHYKMIIGASSFITNHPEEVLVEIRNQRAKSIKSLSKTGRNATGTYSGYDTIEKLYRFVDEERKQGAKKLEVTFDASLGYPAWIRVDRDGVWGNDDELTLTVKSVEIIK